MQAETLNQLLQSIKSPVEYFRNNDFVDNQYVFPDEYTNWIEEQRAVRESCALVDQSYHMQILQVEGPDAVGLLSGLGVNSFEKIKTGSPPQALNLLTCNPEGYVISDVILFYLSENEFYSVGSPYENNWIRYHAEMSDQDVTSTVLYDVFDDESPYEFRFQIQGPDALSVIEEVTDNPLPDISFFEMDEIQIQGVETNALGHGMAATPGLEIFGPFEYHDRIRDAILAAGEQYGIRQMGAKAYKTGKIGSGWLVMSVPAIYQHKSLEDYRKWLGADSQEAQLSIGGSYVSDDITDYYMTPIERGQSHLIDFDHDFIGKAALERKIENKQRERVTFVWDSDDVVDVYASLFGEGESDKYIPLPDTANRWSKTHYDTVLKDGEHVGFSKYPGYLYYEREMLSLGTIDIEYSEPGTEVTFVWGERTGKAGVERHKQREIRATVAPSPYVRGGRRKVSSGT